MKSSLLHLDQLLNQWQSVAVLDDFFPNLLTAFRVAEYNWYLERFPQLTIYSTNPDFKAAHAEYANLYPQYADRVRPYEQESLAGYAFSYINFLNNAHFFLPALSAHCVPFLMTLYPGGGFGLDEPESDAKLIEILESPFLRGIIATQTITLGYLKDKKCPVPVHEIYGGAINPIYFDGEIKNKNTSIESGSVRICFVAERYMPKGANKGYPQFIEAVQKLINEFPNLQFSVVGSFNAEDISLDDGVKECISFNGLMTTTDLKEFFLTQDIIISPNIPFLLHPGNFDGFPSGACVEASLCGVAMICSDELKLNRYYTNNVDIVICDPTSDAIVKATKELINDTCLLKNIGQHGQIISQKIFSPIKQLGQRSALLSNYLENNKYQWAIKLNNKLLFDIKSACRTIDEQENNIRSVEKELAQQSGRVESLKQTITHQEDHILTIETALIKYNKSLCGMFVSGVYNVYLLIRRKINSL